MIRVLLAAPYASVRAGLYALLAGADDFTVVGQVAGSGDLERLLPGSGPDVIVLDAPDGEVGRVLALAQANEAGLVLLGERPDDGLALLHSGLSGWAWLRKDVDASELIAAARAVSVGLIALDPALLPIVTGERRAAGESGPRDETLTVREREVLQWMAHGLPNKQIAARMGISPHTAKFHVASILAKLGAASRTEAVTLGARRGWVLL